MKKALQIIYSLVIIFCTCFNAWAVTHTITVNSNFFSPQSLTINEGDQVVFQLAAGVSTNHPVVSDNGHFPTINWTSQGQTSSAISFPLAGAFNYHCSTNSGMTGTIVVTSVPSGKDPKDSYYLQASPNPFEDEIVLTINQGNKQLTAIRVFDLIGKEVAHIDLRNRSGVISYRLDFSRLNPGVYFCNVYSEAGIVETKKLFRTK